MEAAAPRLVEYVPMMQRLQLAAPVALVKVPAPQFAQGSFPPVPYLPGVHFAAKEGPHKAAAQRSNAVRYAMQIKYMMIKVAPFQKPSHTRRYLYRVLFAFS